MKEYNKKEPERFIINTYKGEERGKKGKPANCIFQFSQIN